MYVVKRDGRREVVHFDKITARLKKLSYGLNQDHCDPILVAQKVCAGVYKGVTTSQLDELAAETAAAMTTSHPDYAQVWIVGVLCFFLLRVFVGFCCLMGVGCGYSLQRGLQCRIFIRIPWSRFLRREFFFLSFCCWYFIDFGSFFLLFMFIFWWWWSFILYYVGWRLCIITMM